MKLEPSTEPIPWARPAIDDAELQAVIACMESGWLTSGPRVEAFERQMAERAGRKFGVAVSNGTAALELALRVVSIEPQDEVIVPAFSYVATASTVAMQHGVPVFIDIDPRNLGIDPNAAAARIGRRTAAILCTDHGGNPCDYAKLTALADRHGLPLIVDGAQSLGSMFAGRPTLSYGLVSTISFHAAKCITTVEGGMVFTDDEALARRMRIIRSQGEDPHRKYHHIELGHNYRMTELQAAIGLAQLQKLDALLADRQSLAAEYQKLFQRHGLTSPTGLPQADNSFFLYSIQVPQRDAVAARLKSRGIDTRVCYPMPLYRQPILRHLKTPRCPVTEETCATILNPPMFYGLSAAQQWRVANELAEAIAALSPRELRAAG